MLQPSFLTLLASRCCSKGSFKLAFTTLCRAARFRMPVIAASGAFSPVPGVTLPIPAFPGGNALRNVFF
jgi:hypothetical protein